MLRRAHLLAPIALALHAALATPARATELTELSLEQLLDEEVVSASRFAQRASEAPSSISVLSADDFRTWGWRTLAEALDSVRGFTTTNSREYATTSVRGFTAPRDLDTRVLLLIDGIRTNSNIQDQAHIGHDFMLSLDLVERIEIVRGPGSMVYGGNALFAVINVITKSGRDLNGTEVSASTGSFDTHSLTVSHGRKLDNGADLLLSATGFESAGQALYFPEIGHTGHGTDAEAARRVFGRYRQGDFQLTALWAMRDHRRPSGAYGSVPDDPRNRDHDEALILEARHQLQLGTRTLLSNRLSYNEKRWVGQYLNDYAGAPYALDRETTHGRTLGLDSQLIHDGIDGHRLLLGVDYQNNLQQDQYAADTPPTLLCTATGSATTPCTDIRSRTHRLGLYLQDDITLGPTLNLNLGLRRDDSDVFDTQWSPRTGLIWRPDAANVVKLLYGKAFRAANAYERSYTYPGVDPMVANPRLRPENIQTWEAIWERYLGPDLRITGGAYFYELTHWIIQTDNGQGALQFQNQPAVHGRGIDLELEKRFSSGARLRTSYAGQFTPEQPNGVSNGSSRHLFKLNFASPLPIDGWHLGLEARYASSAPGTATSTAEYTTANAHLRWQPRSSQNTTLSLGVYNLFDQRYAHSYPDASMYTGIVREQIAQDGRTWQLKLTQRF